MPEASATGVGSSPSEVIGSFTVSDLTERLGSSVVTVVVLADVLIAVNVAARS